MSGLPIILAMSVLSAVLSVVPPLTEPQQRQLADTVDRTPQVDEGSLYALLPNVAKWEADDEVVGRLNVDYTALLAEPTPHRGEVMMVEGRFYGHAHRFNLGRSGVWGKAVTMWVLSFDKDLKHMGVVFLVDPDGRWMEQTPRRGQHVRVPARFFKVWKKADERGQPTEYLTFVGRYPEVVNRSGVGMGGLSGGSLGQMVLLIVLIGGVVLWLIWRGRRLSFKARPLPRQQARHEVVTEARAVADATEMTQAELEDDAPLPDDPAAALDELSHRHEPATDEDGTDETDEDAGWGRSQWRDDTNR